jgi:hypothetical protein
METGMAQLKSSPGPPQNPSRAGVGSRARGQQQISTQRPLCAFAPRPHSTHAAFVHSHFFWVASFVKKPPPLVPVFMFLFYSYNSLALSACAASTCVVVTAVTVTGLRGCLLYCYMPRSINTAQTVSPLYAKGDPIFRVLRDGPQIFELRKHPH